MSLDQDWQLKYISTGIEFVFTSVKAILDHLEGDDKNKYLEDQKLLVLDYLKMEFEHKLGKEILNGLQEHLDVKEASMDTDMEEDFEKKMAAALEKNKKEMEVEALKKHPKYLELEKLIRQKGGCGEDDDDEDAMVTGEVNSLTDPWSQQAIEVPVVNSVCGHAYDKATVTKMHKRLKGKIKCPIVGCANKNNIRIEDLKEDENLKRLIQNRD
eukprot:TRINITY_DN23487_c0_g1_i1.p1 TRINITY_DN23487_c0_g1~~TRINITY_DN23487_c0_g1_i1.p1  ORF type:complete len:213 (-),score=50.60 TRINITY_DN23487_c0_g1_i1:66-704(-)